MTTTRNGRASRRRTRLPGVAVALVLALARLRLRVLARVPRRRARGAAQALGPRRPRLREGSRRSSRTIHGRAIALQRANFQAAQAHLRARAPPPVRGPARPRRRRARAVDRARLRRTTRRSRSCGRPRPTSRRAPARTRAGRPSRRRRRGRAACPRRAADAEPVLDEADRRHVPAGHEHQEDLRGARRRRRHQRHLRPAAQGRQLHARPPRDDVPEGARDGDAAGRPLLQGHRREDDPHRAGHAAEPQGVRGPRHPDVLPVERRREGRLGHGAVDPRPAAPRHDPGS